MSYFMLRDEDACRRLHGKCTDNFFIDFPWNLSGYVIQTNT